MAVISVDRMYVDDSMVKSAIERGMPELAQAFILYMQLDVLRSIQAALPSQERREFY